MEDRLSASIAAVKLQTAAAIVRSLGAEPASNHRIFSDLDYGADEAGRQQIIAVGRWGDSSKDCKIARALPLDRFSAPTRPNARAMAPAQKDRRSTASPARRFRP